MKVESLSRINTGRSLVLLMWCLWGFLSGANLWILSMGRSGKLPDSFHGSDLMLFFMICACAHIVYGIVCVLVSLLKTRPMKVAVAGCIASFVMAGMMVFFNLRSVAEIAHAC